MQEHARKKLEEQQILQRLEKLRKEVDAKQTIHTFEQSVMDQHYNDVGSWDKIDYGYIEYYQGASYCRLISEMDKERRLVDAIVMERRLMEAFELKKQELLLKLKQAHDKFTQNLSQQDDHLDQCARLSRAFVTSYFCFLPDAAAV